MSEWISVKERLPEDSPENRGEESDSLFGVAEIRISKWEAEHTEEAKTITALWFCRMGVGMEPDWCQQSHPLDATSESTWRGG